MVKLAEDHDIDSSGGVTDLRKRIRAAAADGDKQSKRAALQTGKPPNGKGPKQRNDHVVKVAVDTATNLLKCLITTPNLCHQGDFAEVLSLSSDKLLVCQKW